MNAMTRIPFYGNDLITVKKDGQIYVAINPIVEAIGINWPSQRQKIASSDKWDEITMPVDAGDDEQDMIFLPLKKLNCWLYSIHREKCRPEIRYKLSAYQEECFQVLYGYFYGVGARTESASIDSIEQVLADAASSASVKQMHCNGANRENSGVKLCIQIELPLCISFNPQDL